MIRRRIVTALAGLAIAVAPVAVAASSSAAPASPAASNPAGFHHGIPHCDYPPPLQRGKSLHAPIHHCESAPSGRHLGPLGSSENDFSGFSDQADSGMWFNEIQGTVTVPTLDCSDTYIGAKGTSEVDNWIGLEPTSQAEVEQAGIAATCSGTPGHLGSGSATYKAWYGICCIGNTLANFSPSLSAGSSAQLSVAWDSSLSKYDFVLTYGGNTYAFQQSCPSGGGCGQSYTEAVLEEPNLDGGVMNPLPQWTAGNNWSSLAVTDDTNYVGTMAASTDWSVFTHAMNLGNPVINTSQSSEGQPGTLGGSSFSLTCGYWISGALENNCGASGANPPNDGMYWLEQPASHSFYWIKNNGVGNAFTVASAAPSGVNQYLMFRDLGIDSLSHDVLQIQAAGIDGAHNVCLEDDSGTVYSQDCGSGTAQEFVAQPDSGFSGWYLLRNVGNGSQCLSTVAGSGGNLEDVACDTTSYDQAWNPNWYDDLPLGFTYTG